LTTDITYCSVHSAAGMHWMWFLDIYFPSDI